METTGIELITGVAIKIFEYSLADFQILLVVEILSPASQSSQFYEIATAQCKISSILHCVGVSRF
ncbi:hypothetical protein GTQ43_09285 [Nostoc sp. KVJ3]|uniref:hypothetical protein n=1 Tax=Nostoc sp. KVJ3 TaxID=457945 RepID=UPI00223794EC|nr:hypothetical protein [Nostoc sp. KVJ3]MCW5313987.1 hypothetical protein [Nostoc sp. KVJ3]